MSGRAIVTSAKHMTLSPPLASLPHEMHSVASAAPPRPPKIVLSVVIWMAATWGFAPSLPCRDETLVAVIWRKSLGTPPPRKITEVPRPPVIAASMTSVAIL